jgi:hypothetical protein
MTVCTSHNTLGYLCVNTILAKIYHSSYSLELLAAHMIKIQCRRVGIETTVNATTSKFDGLDVCEVIATMGANNTMSITTYFAKFATLSTQLVRLTTVLAMWVESHCSLRL